MNYTQALLDDGLPERPGLMHILQRAFWYPMGKTGARTSVTGLHGKLAEGIGFVG